MDKSQRKIIEEGMTQAFRDGLELGQILATPPVYGVDMQVVHGIVNHAESQAKQTIEAWQRRENELTCLCVEGWYQAVEWAPLPDTALDYLKRHGVPQDIIAAVLEKYVAFREKAKINMGE